MNSDSLFPTSQQKNYKQISLILLLTLFGRGIFVLFLPKSIAMSIQLAVPLSCFCLFFYISSLQLYRCFQPFFLISLAFIIIMALSGLTTSFKLSFHYWFVYVLVNIILIIIMGICLHLSLNAPYFSFLPNYFLYLGWILFSFAIAEQLDLIKLPGATGIWLLTRPASLTGAFLHYPIVMALLSFITLQSFHTYRKKRFLISGIVFWIAPIFAWSRSGILICMIGLLLYICWGMFHLKRHVLLILTILACTLGLLGFAQLQKEETLLKNTANRIFTMASHKSSGNSVRVLIWKYVYSLWEDTQLLIGEYSGMITNTTRNVVAGMTKAHIAESSVLQLLLNFGILGCLLFYALLIYLFFQISPHSIFLRFGFLGALAQTLVYQSIEVLPFMILLMLFPLLSKIFEEFSNEKRKLCLNDI